MNENNDSFPHDFGEPKEKEEKTEIPVIKKQITTRFNAILKGQRLLKEGGLSVTFEIPENNREAVKSMLDMSNMLLDVFVVANEPDTMGDNV